MASAVTATSDETQAAPDSKPANPARAPDVLEALASAALRDPHPDPLKPIGRASFFIWLSIAATLYFVGDAARQLIDWPQIRDGAVATFHGLTGSDHARMRMLGEMSRSPAKLELAAVTGFAAGTFAFAFYYVAVYLIGMNAGRGMVRLGGMVRSGARRIAQWRASRQAARTAAPDGVIETTPAGVEPEHEHG